MTSEIITMPIADLLQLRKKGILKINSEYQRGAVWNSIQQKKLIDSVLRGYPLPIIYLHKIETTVGSITSVNLEIVDGQQRLNSLDAFKEGGLVLFDPIEDDKIARFPKYIKEQFCPWRKHNFDSLSDDLKRKFLETSISVAQIVTSHEDEARDLFIRLQSGLPLNAQEKRDAWPGGFTEFILKMAGKAHKFSGHVFFDDLISTTRIDRGQVRQLCAEMAMLLFEDATNNNWRDLGASDLDDYYYKQLGFNNSGGDALRFRTILDKSYDLMGNRKIKKLKGHEAIHLFLLIAQLQKGYTRSGESKLVDAFENFRAECANAKYNKEGEFWSKYVQWTMTSAHSKSSLSSRHNFFIQKMYNKLSPQSLDTNRIYGELERDIIYYKANKKCAVCDELINWPELEIHHVTEYQHGGQTVLKNGVAVHKSCHPKGIEASEFEKRYFGNKP